MRSLTAYDVRSHDDVNLELVGLPFSTNTPLCERLFLSYFWELDRNHNDFVWTRGIVTRGIWGTSGRPWGSANTYTTE